MEIRSNIMSRQYKYFMHKSQSLMWASRTKTRKPIKLQNHRYTIIDVFTKTVSKKIIIITGAACATSDDPPCHHPLSFHQTNACIQNQKQFLDYSDLLCFHETLEASSQNTISWIIEQCSQITGRSSREVRCSLNWPKVYIQLSYYYFCFLEW